MGELGPSLSSYYVTRFRSFGHEKEVAQFQEPQERHHSRKDQSLLRSQRAAVIRPVIESRIIQCSRKRLYFITS